MSGTHISQTVLGLDPSSAVNNNHQKSAELVSQE